jgi:hypothetical protein
MVWLSMALKIPCIRHLATGNFSAKEWGIPLIHHFTSIVMNLFHKKKYECDQDNKKFDNYEELVEHAKDVHHSNVLKCSSCGKQFIHEKDRLHHVREEHEKEMDARVHKNEHKHEKNATPQEEVDSHMRNFGDNF